MAFLASLFAGTPEPTSDFWYHPVGSMTASGVRVSPESANTISAWYRGRMLLGQAVGMLPFNLYQRLPNDAGATVARDHALYDALHRKPNPTDDAFTFRRQSIFDLIDHGHFYAWIGRSWAWSLERIDPTLVASDRIESGPLRGHERFTVRDEKTGTSTVHTRDDIFHLSLGNGKGILAQARESLGLYSVIDQYAGKVFGAGTLKSGMIELPGALPEEQMRALALSFVTAKGEWHMPKVLPGGAKYVPDSGMTPEDAQMLLSRKFGVTEIARWLGIPPHMIGDLDRSTNNNIEHQGHEFVTYNLGPWLSIWEHGANDQLVMQPAKFFVEFVRDALVRGDIAARWQSYQIAISTGTVTRNEVRRKENMNALDGLDTPLEPAHLTGKQTPDPPAAPEPEPVDEEDPADAQATLIRERAAARVLRKEVAAVSKLAVKHAADGDAFAAAVGEFYAGHVALVADTLAMSHAAAGAYCAGQAAQAVSGQWVAAVETWGTEAYASGLAALAVEIAA